MAKYCTEGRSSHLSIGVSILLLSLHYLNFADSHEFPPVPPTFLQRPPLYIGKPWDSNHFSLSCQIECNPKCDIIWLKDGHPFLDNSNLYLVNSTRQSKNGRNSTVSTLIWNFEGRTNRRLDRIIDESKYTCQSTGNTQEPGISISTFIRVEYPPEQDKMYVLPNFARVLENGIPNVTECFSSGYPEPTYKWMYNDNIISTGQFLRWSSPFKKDMAGNYTCVAINPYGFASMNTTIEIQENEEESDQILSPETTKREVEE